MKVLIINSDYGSGSTGRIVRDIKNELERKQDNCIVLFGRENCANDKNVFRVGNKVSVYFHVLMTRFADKQGFFSRRATKKAISIIDRFNPDIIHLHNLHGSYIDCKQLFDYIKTKKKPVLWTLHDCWSFTGHCSNYSFVSCSNWISICQDCPQKKEYPKSLVDRSPVNYETKKLCFTGCKNLKIVTVSKWLQGEVQQSFLKEYESIVIPNGIDLNIFQPVNCDSVKKRYGLYGKKTLISVASVWGPRKGLDLLRTIAKELGDEYRLLLVGLKENVVDLPTNVISIARTDDVHQLAELYSAADVYINTSVEETFGLVSLEALACGVPVITNGFTANTELIDDTCGVVVPVYTVGAYINAILDEKIWKIESISCRQRAEGYSKEKMIRNYLETYRSMI